MQTRHIVRASTSPANHRQHRSAVLLAAYFDEASDRELQRGEDCGAPGADILSDGAFALGQLAILIKYFDQDFHWNYVATLFSLLSKRNFRNTFGRILSDGPKPGFSAVTGNLVSPRRIFFKASWWTLAN